MRFLKYALIFFAIVDVLMFVVSQVAPEALSAVLPQFDVQSVDHTYQRLVGVLFLMLGLARLYGALYIEQRGALIVWVVELIYTVSELLRGQFVLGENVMALVLAPMMLVWSVVYYRKNSAPNKL